MKVYIYLLIFLFLSGCYYVTNEPNIEKDCYISLGEKFTEIENGFSLGYEIHWGIWSETEEGLCCYDRVNQLTCCNRIEDRAYYCEVK